MSLRVTLSVAIQRTLHGLRALVKTTWIKYPRLVGEREATWATGVLAGAITPLHDDFSVDFGALREYVAWLAASGVTAIIVNADTGEGQHLTQAERLRVLDLVVREVGDAVPILCGLIAGFTAEAEEMAREAEAAGAVGLQVFPPPAFLGGALDPGLAAGYFESVAEATQLPLLVYRPPLQLGYGMDDAVLTRILAVEAVRGLKESSFDEETYRGSLAIARRFEHVKFLSGADTFVARSLEIGADGLALALASAAPRSYVDLLTQARADGISAALTTAREFDLLPALIFAQPFRDFRARLKEALHHMGRLRSTKVRPPLCPLAWSEIHAIESMVEQCGLKERS